MIIKNLSLLIALFIATLSCNNAQEKSETQRISSNADFIIKANSEFPSGAFVSTKPEGNYSISMPGRITHITISSDDYSGVHKVATHLQTDIHNVTGKKPVMITDSLATGPVILIGTLGKSPLIDQLVANGKLDKNALEGKWEKHLIKTVESPFEGVDSAIVIAGSDKRGTIYGMYRLSEAIGVSPWYWWADVPIQKRQSIYMKPGAYTYGEPKVKYRGIFINDEAPALAGWAHEKYGGFNHKFYERVFELTLRLKGNFLWPAMWGRSIYDDDPKSPELADEYGVVLGTSHHEPLSRAHVEWSRHGEGDWNFQTNKERLRAFWQKGMERVGDNESLVTIGMRGDGDEAMSAEADIALLEEIVADQRQIIEEVTGKSAAETPQVWALYKEVQEYYDKGMRVPDDVTLLLCDDNWGNIRKLPGKGDTLRSGGYGIYYHYDYVGGPRNYKWINTNQVSRTWEQMHLAYEYGAKQLWIVNVGDIKPMEFPTDFFLDYAWNPELIPAAKIPQFGEEWAAQQFGNEFAKEIADILEKYTRFNSRRKPELLAPDTYSLTNFKEWERIVTDYNEIAERARQIGTQLPDGYQSAYFQLVLHPVLASANLNELYFTVAKNRYFAENNWKGTNDLADQAKKLFEKDEELSDQYHTINSGKWNHFMDQTHIGYTYWQQPDENNMPEVVYIDEGKAITAGKIPNNTFEDNYISLEAADYTRAIESGKVNWVEIPQIGRTKSGMTPFPVTVAPVKPGGNSHRIEYEVMLPVPDEVTVKWYLSPTLNFHNDEGLEFAASFDDEAPQVVNMHEKSDPGTWAQWVSNNINIRTTTHQIRSSGKHTLKFWMIDPGIVLQKIVIQTGEIGETYLGPPSGRNEKIKGDD